MNDAELNNGADDLISEEDLLAFVCGRGPAGEKYGRLLRRLDDTNSSESKWLDDFRRICNSQLNNILDDVTKESEGSG